MQSHSYGLCYIRRQQERRTMDPNSAFVSFRVRGHFILCDCLQVCASPTRLDEQRMNVRKRTNAPINCMLEAIDGIGLRNGYDSLDIRKCVLASMLCFAGEHSDVFLSSPLFG